MDNVSWLLYEKMLSEVENGGTRLTYFRGRLEIMTLSPEHEAANTLIGRLIEAYCLARDIELQGYGSTTFRSEALDCGLEPDKCYYVAHARYVIERGTLDPGTDPPPDLAIEVDVSRSSVPKQPIYAALGIPEVWLYDGHRLMYLRLENGAYVPTDKSMAFPELSLDRINQFLEIGARGSQTAAVRALTTWARNV